MWEAFAVQKLLSFFQQKMSVYLLIKSKKHLRSWPLNKLVKLTMLWTGPSSTCSWHTVAVILPNSSLRLGLYLEDGCWMASGTSSITTLTNTFNTCNNKSRVYDCEKSRKTWKFWFCLLLLLFDYNKSHMQYQWGSSCHDKFGFCKSFYCRQ